MKVKECFEIKGKNFLKKQRKNSGHTICGITRASLNKMMSEELSLESPSEISLSQSVVWAYQCSNHVGNLKKNI